MIVGAKGVPELPNIFTILEQQLDSPAWVKFMQEWEGVFFSYIAAGILALVFYLGARKKEMIPQGLQNFLELIVETFRGFVVSLLGIEGEKYVPFLGTLFIYILTMNLLGMIPMMSSPSANLNITVALAICVFCLVQVLNIKNMGVKGFLYHLAGSPTNAIGWAIVPLTLPIEIITQISRPITLSLRLFGNIMGEKILVAFFALMGVTMLYFFPIQIPFMLLGILMSVIQAAVFTLLSTIYILLSVPHAEEIHVKH